jgi:hypothetical protein
MDQKDLFAFFLTLRNQYSEDEIPRILETYDISKLDVNRIYRYLDKYMAKPGGCASSVTADPTANVNDLESELME